MKAIAFFIAGFAVVWIADSVFSLVKSCGVKFRPKDILEGALVGLVIVVAIIALTAVFG